MKKRLWLIVAFLTVLCAAVFTACGDDAVKYQISVEGVQNGLITVSTTEAAAGETITVTCTPDNGFMFKEGSLQMNGEPVQGNSFVMPEKDVVLTAKFLSLNYKGTYLFSGKTASYLNAFDFIEIGETLTAGITLEDANYALYEDISYTVDNFVLTATVNGEAWTVEIGNGVLHKGEKEYALTPDFSEKLNGTLTDIPEHHNEAWDFDYTFENGKYIKTTYFEDGSDKREDEASYKLFGAFLIIEEESDYDRKDPITYGVLKEDDGIITFLYNAYFVSNYSGNVISYNSTRNLYRKNEQEITLKENGAYIYAERINSYTGKDWGKSDCYDFLSMRGGELALSVHSGDYHYFSSSAEYERHGNIMKVSYTLVTEGTRYAFHIVDENTIYVKDTANTFTKFVFRENASFEGGYGKSYSNTESTTYEVSFYEHDEYGNKYFDKTTNGLVDVREYGTYQVYGDILVVELNGGAKHIGKISEGSETDEYEYLYEYSVVEWNRMCSRGHSEPLWKTVGGGK